jgi:hypothetical protein
MWFGLFHRGQFLVAESARLYLQEVDLMKLRAQDDDGEGCSKSVSGADPNATIIVVVGHTGSAVSEVASLLLSRLSLRGSNLFKLDMSDIDTQSLSDTCREFRKNIVNSCKRFISNAPVVVSLTINPIIVPDLKLVLENIVPSNCLHVFSLCVVDAGALDRFKMVLSDRLASSQKENAHFSNDRCSFFTLNFFKINY